MYTIETAKEHFIETLEGLDKTKMNLYDLQVYAQILKITSDIQTTNYNDVMAQALGDLTRSLNVPRNTAELEEIKGAAENGV